MVVSGVTQVVLRWALGGHRHPTGGWLHGAAGAPHQPFVAEPLGEVSGSSPALEDAT